MLNRSVFNAYASRRFEDSHSGQFMLDADENLYKRLTRLGCIGFSFNSWIFLTLDTKI